MALIYRAHFAFSKNPRINSKGINTSATLGFTNSLLEILNKEKPTHIAVAFDTPAPTFRHEAFVEYKAQREAQPEDIRVAIPTVKEIVKAFNIPVLELDGFEADDIIGTFAKKASKAGFEVYMMTPDKDYSQLVEEHVFLYKPAFMGNGVDILGVKEVLEKWDIENVDQVRDILGLMGDSVDNIPGIPGIGPKTASKLIKQYGSVEELVKNCDDLKGKQKENVMNFCDQGILSKELATIHINVPIAFDENELKLEKPNEEKLKALFDELEFRTLMRRVFGIQEAAPAKAPASGQMSMFDSPPSAPTSVSAVTALVEEEPVTAPVPKDSLQTVVRDYHLIHTPELRKSLIQHLSLQEEFCFDTETNSLDACSAELVGLAFSYYPTEAYYVPVPADQEEAKAIVKEFKAVFEDKAINKIGQNLKYDILVLKKYGVNVSGTLYDTMLAHYLLEPDMRHNMDVMAETYLNYITVPIEELIGKKGVKQGNMRDVAVDEVANYAGEDADITLQLKYKLFPLLKDQGIEKLYFEVEAPLINVLASMEDEGVYVDTPTLVTFSEELEIESRKIEQEIYDIAGVKFNIASPKQLGEVLFEKLNLVDKPKKTKTGQYATGEEILSRLAAEHAIAEKILDFRELQKLKSTYVDALPSLINDRDGRIHTCYNQAVAATGRLSSTNPNLQNIPIRTEKGREIRKAFVARNEDFEIMAADYSQIELRIMAAFSKDESMIEAFQQGRDIHNTTASKIFKVPMEAVDSDMRRKAKTANFGIIYGISAFGLSQRLNIPRREAGDIIEAYFQEFPAVKAYMDRVISEARENEYVETILGRRRYLRDINSRNATLRGYAERNAINAPIQGSAADMIKVAMIKIHDWMASARIDGKPLASKMIMQVHDELVFEVHKSEKEIVAKHIIDFMKNAILLEVPMEVEVGFGANWLLAH